MEIREYIEILEERNKAYTKLTDLLIADIIELTERIEILEEIILESENK